jgi:zinc/manganese transport system permease protein
VIAAGFWSSGPAHTALLAGAVVAVVSGVVGVLTVVRGQSFAGHALGDMDTLGGSGALLVGVTPLAGFVTVGAVVAATMELFGVQRARGRDVATGVVLGAALGVSALLLYLDATSASTTGATVTVLFGSLFALPSSTATVLVGLGAAGMAAVVALYRPLLLASVHPDLATAAGVRVRALGVAFLVLLGVAVSLSSVAVGSILSTALLIGPAAAALRVTRRPGAAMAAAAATGVVATWLGVVLSYDSYGWPPEHRGWPVSFFVVTLVLAAYLVAGAIHRLGARRRGLRGVACSAG